MLGTVCYVIDALTRILVPSLPDRLDRCLLPAPDSLRGLTTGLPAHPRREDTTPASFGFRRGLSRLPKNTTTSGVAVKHIETQVDLPADPSVVWEELVATTSMASWDRFITPMAGVIKVEERVPLRIAPVGGRPMMFKPRVTVVEPSRRLEWVGTMGMPELSDRTRSRWLPPVTQAPASMTKSPEESARAVARPGQVLDDTARTASPAAPTTIWTRHHRKRRPGRSAARTPLPVPTGRGSTSSGPLTGEDRRTSTHPPHLTE